MTFEGAYCKVTCTLDGDARPRLDLLLYYAHYIAAQLSTSPFHRNAQFYKLRGLLRRALTLRASAHVLTWAHRR